MKWGIYLGSLLLVLLSIRFYTFLQVLPEYDDGQDVRLLGKVGSVPAISSRMQRFIFLTNTGQKMYVTTSVNSEYYYGQKIHLVGKLKEVELDEKKSILTISFPKIQAEPRRGVVGRVTEELYLQSSLIRDHIISFYARNLPQNGAAFLSGVVLGVDNGMSKEYRDSLSRLGVIHVVAASGMNVSILAGIFFSLFSGLFHRKVAVIFSIVAIAFYIVLAGGQASIVRAGIMGSIAFSAGLFGRQYFGILALFVTAFVMLIISPLYIEDVGFQLSFLSTFGLLLLPKFFERFALGRIGRLRLGTIRYPVKLFSFIKEDFLLTLSAQIMTLPLLFYHFGSYSVVSLPVNLLVLWVIPPLMILGGLGAVASFIASSIGRVFLLLSVPFLYYFEWVIGIFSQIPGVFELRMPISIALGYYLLLLSLFLFTVEKKEV